MSIGYKSAKTNNTCSILITVDNDDNGGVCTQNTQLECFLAKVSCQRLDMELDMELFHFQLKSLFSF